MGGDRCLLIRDGTVSGAFGSRLHGTPLEERIPAPKQCSPMVKRDKLFREINQNNQYMAGTSAEQVYTLK